METYRVLVADDDKFIHAMIKISLRRTDYVVNFVNNGLEAIETIRIKRPDILITDGLMPALTGFELINAMRDRADTAAMPIILLTASNDLRAEQVDENRRPDIVLSKPFKPDSIIASLKQAEDLIRLRGPGKPRCRV